MSYDGWQVFANHMQDVILVCPHCGKYIHPQSEMVTTLLADIDAHRCES